MKIDNKLNLVIPIETPGEPTIYVHSMPISSSVFEQYFMVLSRAYSLIYQKGLHLTAPKIAHLIIKMVAEQEGEWESVQRGLMNEIIRLTNVVTASDAGYVTSTLSDALARKVITEDEFNDIKGRLCFFMLASAAGRKELIEPTLVQMSDLWGTSITSLNCTGFKDSLMELMREQTTAPSAAEKALSIPC